MPLVQDLNGSREVDERLLAPIGVRGVALQRIVAGSLHSGLAGLIDPDDFQVAGGCYNPRKIRGGDKGGAISRHAWGIAIDINPSDNPYGGIVRFDERLASIFRGWGFAWGGGWLYTDGAHFEWNHLPVHISAT